MSNSNLSNELAKRIFENLGVADGNIKNAGLFIDQYLLSKKLKFDDGDSFNVWAGENYAAQNPLKVIVSNISSASDELDLILILNQDDLILTIRFFWDDRDPGLFMMRHEDKWVEIDMVYKLNITAAFEMITQHGIPWTPLPSPDQLYSILISTLSEGDD